MIAQDLNPKEFTILIVDDAEPNLVLLSFVLKEEGFNVLKARDGEEAIQKVQSHEPDLILLDILMPGMNGYEVSKRIKSSEYAAIPIIFLSALNETESKVDAFESGGVDFINKPFKKEEVIARIKTHLFIRKLQKQKEGRLRLLKDREIELSKLNKKKDELIRMVSHDIKNPLTGIIGMTQILIEDEDIEAEERKEILDLVYQSAEKLFELVKETLDKESNDVQVQDLNIQETDIIEFCKKSAEKFKNKASLKGIELSVKPDIDELLVPFDNDKLSTVLEILITNAIRFTLDGGSIEISIEKHNDDHCLLKVMDTGIGISSEILDNFIIQTENEADKESTFDSGLDLGLDIVQRKIKSHNGNIWVSSEEESGTTFYIELPLQIK